jgi:hypothetical protein
VRCWRRVRFASSRLASLPCEARPPFTEADRRRECAAGRSQMRIWRSLPARAVRGAGLLGHHRWWYARCFDMCSMLGVRLCDRQASRQPAKKVRQAQSAAKARRSARVRGPRHRALQATSTLHTCRTRIADRARCALHAMQRLAPEVDQSQGLSTPEANSNARSEHTVSFTSLRVASFSMTLMQLMNPLTTEAQHFSRLGACAAHLQHCPGQTTPTPSSQKTPTPQ